MSGLLWLPFVLVVEMERQRNRFLWRPLKSAHSGLYRLGIDADNLGPITGSVPVASVIDEDVCLYVPLLLMRCCPPAIFWRIAFCSVNAVNGVFWRWPISHVFIKRLKRIAPPVAHFNSASAILEVRSITWLFTPRNHPAPKAVFNTS